MSEQKVLVILKPDCLQRGLMSVILSILEGSGLRVLRKETRSLTRELVLTLYEEYQHTETFSVLVDYMTSGECLVLLLSGENAVSAVIQMKGRTGSGRGIRGMYAESFIRNIIHSAETAYKTSNEIRMFFPEEDVSMNKRKIIFGLSGMTECGKSTAGVFFDEHRVKRLKIAKVLDLVRLDQRPDVNLDTFVNESIRDNPDWLRQVFADKLLVEMDRLGIVSCSLESMGDPEMVRYLRTRFPGEFFSIYIDATLSQRLDLQMIRENLTDIEDAKKILMPKDEFKERFWRMPDIKGIADHVIDNNGTLDAFKEQLQGILKKYQLA